MNKTQVLQAVVECLAQNPLTAPKIHLISIDWDDQAFSSSIIQEEGRRFTENVDTDGDTIPIPVDGYNSVEGFLDRAGHMKGFMLSLADNPVLDVNFARNTRKQFYEADGIAKIIECLLLLQWA